GAGTFGKGNTGDITVTADWPFSDGMGLSSPPVTGIDVGLAKGSTGNGGTITVNAPDVTLIRGGKIIASGNGSGNGANINVTGDSLVIDGQGYVGGILTLGGTAGGKGGDVTVTATGDVEIKAGGEISTASFGKNAGGKIGVTA